MIHLWSVLDGHGTTVIHVVAVLGRNAHCELDVQSIDSYAMAELRAPLNS